MSLPTSSASGRPGPYQRRNVDPFGHIRRNQRIKAPEVRVIGPDGKQLGILTVEKALHLAVQAGLDLVEVAPNANPPVCRILDFGKYKYEEQKKAAGAKAAAGRIKEIKLRARIEPHDFETKLRKAENFLYHGNKLKLTLQFRGQRELLYKETGFQTIGRAISELGQIGSPDNEPKLSGRTIVVMMSPLPANKRKLKYNEPHQAQTEAPDEDDDDAPEDDDSPDHAPSPAPASGQRGA